MAGQTMAAFDAMLKDVYRGPAVEQLNQDTYLIDQLERQEANQMGAYTGRRLVFPVHTSRNRGRGAVTSGGQLPTAGRQGFLDGIVSIKNLFTTIQLDDQLFRASATNEGAFVRALEVEIDGATTDLRKDITRMAYGTGDGLLASCTSTQSARTIAVDNGQYIAVGDTVDVLTRADGTVKGQGVLVTAVAFTGTAATSSQANANVTLASSVSVTNADGIYIAGDRGNESDGLRNIISTSRSLHSIDSSVNPIWDANTNAAGWVNVNEDTLMQQAQLTAQRGKPIDLYVASYGIQRRLALQYQSMKRFTDANAVRVNGGYDAIMLSAGGKPIPVVADADAVNGEAYGLRKDTFNWAQMGSPDWLQAPDGEGGIWHLTPGATAGTFNATWQAFFGWYATLVCVRPNANCKVTQLLDDIPVARI